MSAKTGPGPEKAIGFPIFFGFIPGKSNGPGRKARLGGPAESGSQQELLQAAAVVAAARSHSHAGRHDTKKRDTRREEKKRMLSFFQVSESKGREMAAILICHFDADGSLQGPAGLSIYPDSVGVHLPFVIPWLFSSRVVLQKRSRMPFHGHIMIHEE